VLGGRVRAVGLLGAVLALTGASACGRSAGGEEEPAGPDAPRWRLSYRLSGGIAGFDVEFEVDASGRARYERRHPRPLLRSGVLASAEVEALARLVRTSGFLGLEPRYESKVPVSDAFVYAIRWQADGREQVVLASDGAAMPPAFLAVREAVAALERSLLGQGEGGP
jgi:hypothetical protein